MSLETEAIIDRRRLRRRLAYWRSAAIAFVGLTVGALLLGREGLSTLAGTSQIARVAIEGTITDDRDQIRMLEKIRDASHVKALLVFVNSPGGTTTGGESLYLALRSVAEKKPVVAQFGTVAASAGYIVGLGTDYIVARGNTLTGSIGVLAQWPEVSQLLDKLGVTFNEVKSGDLKAQPNPFAPASPEARKVMQETIDDGFQWFLSLVEARRGIKPSEVSGLMQGRIYSGRQALAAKLVDEIGGETEAVHWLEDKRGIPRNLSVVSWKPEREDQWGLGSSLSSWIAEVLTKVTAKVAGTANIEAYLRGVGLDGLVSVWQPSQN